MRLEPTAPPCCVVIFGATGDLTRRKLLPALYRLVQQRLVPSEFAILGTARQPHNDDEFRELMKAAATEFGDEEALDENAWQSFAKRIFYIGGDFNDAALFQQLKTKLEELDKEFDTAGNRIFYLATAPDYFAIVAKQLGEAGIAKPGRPSKATKTKPWTRIIVEKPFGRDLASAQASGDYLTGSNHVLPTSGAAAARGGLSAADFVRISTVQRLTAAGLRRVAPHAIALAEAEGLTAHAESIRVRGTRP